MLRGLRKILKEVLIASLLLFLVSNLVSFLRKPHNPRTTIQGYTFELVDGTRYTPKKGKSILVHFWLPNCPSCKLMHQSIDALSKKYEVVTVAVGFENKEALKHYLKQKGLGFRVVHDGSGEVAAAFGVKVYPTEFIYDGNGELSFSEVGFTSAPSLRLRLEAAAL